MLGFLHLALTLAGILAVVAAIAAFEWYVLRRKDGTLSALAGLIMIVALVGYSLLNSEGSVVSEGCGLGWRGCE